MKTGENDIKKKGTEALAENESLEVYIACKLRVMYMRMPEVGELHKVYNKTNYAHFRILISGDYCFNSSYN